MNTLVFRVVQVVLAVGDDVWHLAISAGDLAEGTVLRGMAVPRVHLKSYLLVVMVDLYADAVCGRRERGAGSAALSLLLRVFSLDGLKQIENVV